MAAIFEGKATARTFGYGAYAGRTIQVDSTFDGYNTIVNRPVTDGQPAYNYNIDLLKTGEDTGQRLRAFTGGRWDTQNLPIDTADGQTASGDGDHTLQFTSAYGLPNTWAMFNQAPELWQGGESGYPNTWFHGNYLQAQTIPTPNGWAMYNQVEIDPGQPIDIAGEVAWPKGGCDRIMLATSPDCKHWTRMQSRGVIVNLPIPTESFLHHEEVICAPWDPDGKIYWMYVFIDVAGNSTGMWRIRSSDPTTFDFNAKEATTGISQIGNQMGYLNPSSMGAPQLFSRITFTSVGANNRAVPALQYSTDGLNWCQPTVSVLEGSSTPSNPNCYFLGLATLNGTGSIEYIGNNQWRAVYGATTCTSPVAPDIFTSEIGSGTVTITLPTSDGNAKTWEFTLDAEGWDSAPKSGLGAINFQTGGFLGATIAGANSYCSSPGNLGATITGNPQILIRVRNSSSSVKGQISFTTSASPAFDNVKQATFSMVANDPNFTTYVVDMSAVPSWTGTLQQIRFSPTTATSGSFQIDSIHIGFPTDTSPTVPAVALVVMGVLLFGAASWFLPLRPKVETI